jgi:hypothetical protein
VDGGEDAGRAAKGCDPEQSALRHAASALTGGAFVQYHPNECRDVDRGNPYQGKFKEIGHGGPAIWLKRFAKSLNQRFSRNALSCAIAADRAVGKGAALRREILVDFFMELDQYEI